MHQSVSDAFFGFSQQFEGRLNFMYLDIQNQVTTGIGNLIDPIDQALGLPWIPKSDGDQVGPDTIREEWNNVKSRTDLSSGGGGAFDSVTTLKLKDDAIDTLVLSKLAQNEASLKQIAEFQGYDGWPADAQLGLLSMAWAMGPARLAAFPSFRAACASATAAAAQGDAQGAANAWNQAAAQSHMKDTDNPGLKPRNSADNTLFKNAGQVALQGLDITVLQFPSAL